MFNKWWESAKELYGLSRISGSPKDTSTRYYDPLIDYHFTIPNAGGHINLAHELVPQKNDAARLLYKGAAEFLGWTDLRPVREGAVDFTTLRPSPSLTVRGMALAREFGDDAVYAKLKAYAEENYEPTWDKSSGEFT